ncbi:glycosyltransferase [Nocardioides marmotae]|uniref:glycosyltransferase n=1 Tax=Nocardioides marmotae TaxID=2663857 RepID=UPI0013208F12|nr:nucleotide disphospho-sugar-binding domain-containing protein [Nocardioides marmotae]MBC9731662.1 glycosyltransferase [Nocardioides marmotae]MTB82784.1 glycosyltransferase [Nocardioides marmotae]
MRFVLALPGSRGDVQPALAVALELRRRGHEVVVAVAPDLAGTAQALGLDPVAVGPHTRALLGSDLVRRDMRSASPVRRFRALRAVAAHGWDEWRSALVPLVGRDDVVVTGLLGQEVAAAVTERAGAGFAALHYCPVRPSGAVPLVPRGGRRVQRAAWSLGERVRWDLTRAAEREQRAALGLAAPRVHLPDRLRDRGALEVQAYDPLLVPGVAEEWGARRPLVGFLDLAPADRVGLGPGVGDGPDDGSEGGLEGWLAAGPAPVYVGLGSMPVPDPAALVATLTRAAADLGVRVLLSSGWSDPATSASDDVRVVGPVDHARVLPRCRAAVHHGGAGTTAAALRAGLPAVVAWFSADQPVWGRLLARQGVGTALPFRELDAPRLTAALGEVLDEGVARRAAELGARLVPPASAVATTADLLERVG